MWKNEIIFEINMEMWDYKIYYVLKIERNYFFGNLFLFKYTCISYTYSIRLCRIDVKKVLLNCLKLTL